MSIAIKGEIRKIFGKNESRRIRKEGRLPAVLYGSGKESVPLVLEKRDVFTIVKSESGENTIFKVSFDSESTNVMIKDLQRDPVSDEILHADLIQIAMDKSVKVFVPFILTGEAIGVKAEGGFVDFVTREVEVECLPKDIPENIEVDISDLHMHQSLKLEDIPAPEGTSYVTDSDHIVVLIEAPAKEEVVVVEEELEEAEEEVEGEEPKKEPEEAEEKKEGEKGEGKEAKKE